jgi:hypothetical protein
MKSQAEFFHNTAAPYIVKECLQTAAEKELGHTLHKHESNRFAWWYGSIFVPGRCQVQNSVKLHANSSPSGVSTAFICPSGNTPRLIPWQIQHRLFLKSPQNHHRRYPSSSCDRCGTASVNDKEYSYSHHTSARYAIPRPDT